MSARIFGLRFSIFYAFLTIGLGMQLPFLPLWLHAKGLTVAEIGLVIAGMTASRFVAIPVAAYFADRYRNRRGLIILFSLASAFGYLLLGLSSGFLPILASAIFASICIAPIFTLAECFSVDGSAHHGLDYGRLRLWGSVSFLLGNLGAGRCCSISPSTTLSISLHWPRAFRFSLRFCSRLTPISTDRCKPPSAPPIFSTPSEF